MGNKAKAESSGRVKHLRPSRKRLSRKPARLRRRVEKTKAKIEIESVSDSEFHNTNFQKESICGESNEYSSNLWNPELSEVKSSNGNSVLSLTTEKSFVHNNSSIPDSISDMMINDSTIDITVSDSTQPYYKIQESTDNVRICNTHSSSVVDAPSIDSEVKIPSSSPARDFEKKKPVDNQKISVVGGLKFPLLFIQFFMFLAIGVIFFTRTASMSFSQIWYFFIYLSKAISQWSTSQKSKQISSLDRLQYRAQRRRGKKLMRKNFLKYSKITSGNKNRKRLSTKQRKMIEEKVDSLVRKIHGNRIIDPVHFVSEVKRLIKAHILIKGSKCKLEHLHLERQSDLHGGLRSLFYFKCAKCKKEERIWSSPKDDSLDLNKACVLGCLFAGTGYTQANTIFSAMHIPFMTANTFRDQQNTIYSIVSEVAKDSMKKAGEEEASLAREAGDVDEKSGLPLITVIVDGCWLKRSYRKKYDSLSGAGVIIGARTGKVLYVGCKNKYCHKCYLAERDGKKPQKHPCARNFPEQSPSSQMESEALVQGFVESITVHGLIYNKFIGDGDSNFYKKLLDENPYNALDIVPCKIECVNHLFRNFCEKLRMISLTTQKNGKRRQNFTKVRNVVKEKIIPIRRCIEQLIAKEIAATNTDCKTKAQNLRRNILNVPSHIFGEHKKCDEYGFDCINNKSENEPNWVPHLKSHDLYDKVEDNFKSLTSHAESLLQNMTNNKVESFNSIICKMVNGKRVNYALSNQYDTRVYIAVIEHNSETGMSDVFEAFNAAVPETVTELEKSRKKKVDQTRHDRNVNGRRKRVHGPRGQSDYGPNCEKPDKSEEEMEILKQELLNKLNEYKNDREQIEVRTREQSNCNEWMSLRKRLLTASNFSKICKTRVVRSFANKVKDILYSRNAQTEAMKYGLEMEEIAREELSNKLNKKIHICGLFIDDEFPMLGASPDGIIDADTIVELKNPLRAANMTCRDAIKQFSDLKFVIEDTERTSKSKHEEPVYKINTKHPWYYQVQGQLRVTKAKVCYLAMRTQKDMMYKEIPRDDEFWENEMKEKLLTFYNDWMIPEIIDSRKVRSMPIRFPSYVNNIEVKNKTKNNVLEALITEEIDNNENSEKQVDGTVKKTTKKRKTKATEKGVKKMKKENNKEEREKKNPVVVARKRRRVAPESKKVVKYARKKDSVKNVRNDTDDDGILADDCDVQITSVSNDPRKWTDADIASFVTFMDRDYIDLSNYRESIANTEWLLNDDVLDAFILVAKAHEKCDYQIQSVLYLNNSACITPTNEKSLAILGGSLSTGHWRLAYYNGSKVKIYETYYKIRNGKKVLSIPLHAWELRYIKTRWPNVMENNIEIILCNTKQPDAISCGVYAAAMMTHMILHGDPTDIELSTAGTVHIVGEKKIMRKTEFMRRHFLQLLNDKKLSDFPTVAYDRLHIYS